MPIWRQTSSGQLRRWAPTDEALEVMDIQLAHYYSDGYRIAADLYKPKGLKETDKLPAIVIVGGYTVIKETSLPDYAYAFTKAGFVTLAFDFRGFGESDGRRGDSTWQNYVEDTRNAVTFLQHCPGVDPDRIGVWGSSYGGGVVSYALSIDDRIKAGVAQSGLASGGEQFGTAMPPEQQALMKQMVAEDRRRRTLHNDPMYAEQLDLMANPSARQFFEELYQDYPQMFGREVTLKSLESASEFEPFSLIEKKGSRALMFIAGTRDEIATVNVSRRMYEKTPEPKEWREYDADHFGIYEPSILQACAADAVGFFKKYL